MVSPISAIVAVYLVAVGLMLGSFINLAADRLPRGESIVRPSSHCRACGRRLTVIDLLPVAGYLLRGARCATCRTSIGASTLVVEAVAGALVVAGIAWQGLFPGAVIGLALVGLWGSIVTAYAMRRHREEQAVDPRRLNVDLSRIKRVAPRVTLADDAGPQQLAQ